MHLESYALTGCWSAVRLMGSNHIHAPLRLLHCIFGIWKSQIPTRRFDLVWSSLCLLGSDLPLSLLHAALPSRLIAFNSFVYQLLRDDQQLEGIKDEMLLMFPKDVSLLLYRAYAYYTSNTPLLSRICCNFMFLFSFCLYHYNCTVGQLPQHRIRTFDSCNSGAYSVSVIDWWSEDLLLDLRQVAGFKMYLRMPCFSIKACWIVSTTN